MARKPAWLNKKIDLRKCEALNRILKEFELNTVCQEAKCPNMSECFFEGVATFLILGKICTRGCKFCAVDKGAPKKPDPGEPARIAKAVKTLNLKHVVITSVTRDDLKDGGAGTFYDTIKAINKMDKNIKIEVLVPDFKGNIESIRKVVSAGPDIFAHNVETVPSLYDKVRKGADYKLSLEVLKAATVIGGHVYTKSGLMLGLGEKEEDILNVFSDLRRAGCDFLSIGQYLSPSLKHVIVDEYIPPEKFGYYKRKAEEAGFLYVESGSYVRSSYLASKYLTSK
jgi:lipoyl synthase